MAAAIDTEARVNVALVSCDDAARDQLRSALDDRGARVVAEQDAAQLDVAAIHASGASVVIVSLPPDADSDIDALQSLLENPGIDVVFDEASVSGQLNGWDLARWARHLAAKVLGTTDIDPPRPAAAESAESDELIPDPGAPPTPEQLAGEPLIEEFTIEADEHADAVPTDFLPMEDAAGAAADADETGLELDLGSVESALSGGDVEPEVAPTAVPDAPADDRPDDTGFELPEADLSSLELEPEVDAEPVVEADPAQPAVVDAGNAEAAPDMTGEVSVGVAVEPEGTASADPFAGTLAAVDSDDDEDEHARFARFDTEDAALDLGADEDVMRLAAELEGHSEASAAEDVAEGFDSIRFDEEGNPEPDVSIDADTGEASREAAAGASGEEPGQTAPAGAGMAFSLEDLTEDDVRREPQPTPVDERPATSASSSGLGALALEPMREDEPTPREDALAIKRVIVLGASIGGPDALRTFLSDIPKGFPALFLLAQHLESGFFGRLSEQLQKSSSLPVSVAEPGHSYVHGHVLVVAADRNYRLRSDGRIIATEHAEKPHYQPCIDDVLRAVADEFGKKATAIIFSGMAGDAIEGSVYLTSKGGEVWAQDSESCVVSSMVDGARARGVVEFSGSPRELAAHCIERYSA
ncbi:MAG: chemotaxis protein CheB [Xanthomonadales bacterium]|nr:chemotaxis protein CheB [Xanthomonadales bacterium]